MVSSVNKNLLISLLLLFSINHILCMQKEQPKQIGSFCGSLKYRVKETLKFLKEEYFSQESKEKNMADELQTNGSAKPLAAVFDIDFTALNSGEESYNEVAVQFSLDSDYFEFYKAIPQILELYKKLVEQKVAIFFITSRCKKLKENSKTNDNMNFTSENLKEVGFTEFKKIYCMSWRRKLKMLQQYESIEDHLKYVSIWKACKRQKIAKNYKIILTADDEYIYLQGENLGYALWVPR